MGEKMMPNREKSQENGKIGVDFYGKRTIYYMK